MGDLRHLLAKTGGKGQRTMQLDEEMPEKKKEGSSKQDRGREIQSRAADKFANPEKKFSPKFTGNNPSGQSSGVDVEPQTNYAKDYGLELPKGYAKQMTSGLSTVKSFEEMIETLKQSGRDHFDPDDPLNTRRPSLPRIQDDPNVDMHTVKTLEKYFGRGRTIEKRTFDHFHKSFPLSPTPPQFFQSEDPTGREENDPNFHVAGMFLPHPYKWIPDWSHRKQIAAVYGPQYINYVSVKLPKLPSAEAIHEKRIEKQRQRAYRKSANKIKEKLQKESEKLATGQGMEKIFKDASSNYKDQYSDHKVTFVGLRPIQRWNPETFRTIKEDGDPDLPKEFRDVVYENFLNTIDKNNSLPPWKKIYAMHLIPRAFGGPEGDFLSELQEEPEVIVKVDDSLFESTGGKKEEKKAAAGVDELGL